MSVRNVDANLVKIIRDLQEDIKLLKANQGSVRLNSIRLGNWVLETVDDSLVQMTNLTTGEVSYIGGVSEPAEPVAVPADIDHFAFSYPGLVAPNGTSESAPYMLPYAGTLTHVVVAFSNAPSNAYTWHIRTGAAGSSSLTATHSTYVTTPGLIVQSFLVDADFEESSLFGIRVDGALSGTGFNMSWDFVITRVI